METARHILVLFLAFAVILPTLMAHIAEFDSYWESRAKEAEDEAQKAYEPDPEKVTDGINKEVQNTVGNGTRRNLRRYKGPCLATNPIDRCWRCDPNWASNRKKLATCALGFGRKATGGLKGEFYEVTDPSDDDMVNPKPGTLRHAVIQERPLWITFAHGMVITLKNELMITSDKTIDARGANVHIAFGAQITLQYVKNVIIHGLHVHDNIPAPGGTIRDSASHFGLRTQSDGDGISMFGVNNVWIDHISLSNCKDGLIDAIMGSTAITISNCHMTHHNEVMLFGGSNDYTGDKLMQITLAFNHFGRGLVQRMPRVRFGFVHVVNNDYTWWQMYAIGGSQGPTILSQGNRYVAPPNQACKEVCQRNYASESEWKNWNWRSENDLLLNGATFTQSGKPIQQMDRHDVIKAKPGAYVGRLTRFSGALDCFVGKPC